MKQKAASLFFLGALFFSPALWSFQVVASIAPLGNLAASLLKGITTPEVLLDGALSPHTYHLRPSDLKKLARADLILWIGPSYETFLQKPLTSLKAPAYSLLNTPHLTLFPYREQEEGSSCCKDHALHTIDPHIWLDPDNALQMTLHLSALFKKALPEHALRITENAAALVNSLKKLKNDFKKELLPLQDQGFLVFHDGYQYIEKSFNLKGLGSIVLNPEDSLSIKRRRTLQKMIQEKGVICLFSEPQFTPKLVEELIKETGLRLGQLDPLGEFMPKGGGYETLLSRLKDEYVRCLTPLKK